MPAISTEHSLKPCSHCQASLWIFFFDLEDFHSVSEGSGCCASHHLQNRTTTVSVWSIKHRQVPKCPVKFRRHDYFQGILDIQIYLRVWEWALFHSSFNLCWPLLLSLGFSSVPSISWGLCDAPNIWFCLSKERKILILWCSSVFCRSLLLPLKS